VIEDPDVTRLPRLLSTEMGCQAARQRTALSVGICWGRQWRAGQKNPQASGSLGDKAQALASCQCLSASGGPRLAMYFPHMTSNWDPVRMIRLRFGGFGGQVPTSVWILRRTGYIIDPDYPEEAYFRESRRSPK